jgi:hypothetical protein
VARFLTRWTVVQSISCFSSFFHYLSILVGVKESKMIYRVIFDSESDCVQRIEFTGMKCD